MPIKQECPVCGTGPIALVINKLEQSNLDKVEQDCSCDHCQSSWTWQYERSGVINVDGPPDWELSAQTLRLKYDRLAAGKGWGSHPDFRPADWRNAVCAEDTQLGYWDWVVKGLDEATH